MEEPSTNPTTSTQMDKDQPTVTGRDDSGNQVEEMETEQPTDDNTAVGTDGTDGEDSDNTIETDQPADDINPVKVESVAEGSNSGTDASHKSTSAAENKQDSHTAADTEKVISATDILSSAAMVAELDGSENFQSAAGAEDEDLPWTDLVQQLVNSVGNSTTENTANDQQIVVIVGGDDEKKNNVITEHLENGMDEEDHEVSDQMDLSQSGVMSEFRCWYCEEFFDSNTEREEHEKTHTESRFVLLICQECGQSFRKSEEFEKHHQVCGMDNEMDMNSSYSGENSQIDSGTGSQETKGMTLICVFCNSFYDDKDSLRKHLVLKHEMVQDNANPKMYACKFCDKNLRDRVLMLAHEATHKADSRFQCSYCWKMCANKGSLIQHERTHTSSKRLKCPHCEKESATARDLKDHIRLVHISSFNKLTCEYCYVIFVTRKDLQEHLKNTHNVTNLAVPRMANDTNYICSECGKEFDHKAKRQFDEHIATHTRDNLFTCDECGKTFVRARELRYHKARHRGEGRYMCGLCQKNFVLKWDLKKHLKVIHDIDEDGSFDRKPAEKKARLMEIFDRNTVMDDIFKVNPYICRICHAQFEGGKELRMHRKTHEDDEANEGTNSELASFPFICSFCSKGFQNKTDFVEHVGEHTKGTAGHMKTFPLIAPKQSPVGTAPPTVAALIATSRGTTPVVTRRPKKALEKGEGIDFWRCCFSTCFRLTTTYTDKEEFRKHIEEHMTPNNSVCEFCGRCFARPRDMVYHKKLSGVRPCKYLDVKPQSEEDKSPTKPKKPILIAPAPAVKVLDSNSHQCGCGKYFFGFKDFQLHVLGHKSTKDNMFCQYCGRNFQGREALQEHLKENSSDPCKYASGKLVNVRVIENGDSVTSNGEQSVQDDNANIMNIVLVQPTTTMVVRNAVTVLPTNMSSRSPKGTSPIDKPFSCSYCGKAFRGRSYLREHETMHTKEAKFPCDLCDRRFTRARELRYHQKKHDGEEPFPCDKCDKRFVTKANFRAHMENFHEKEFNAEELKLMDADDKLAENIGGSAFKCSFCDKHFNLLDHFKAHMEIVHDVEVSVVTPEELNDAETPVLQKEDGDDAEMPVASAEEEQE